jgi:tRNA pseudouridine38-40 synthase
MPTFKLTVAYDGTGFVGWQRQAAGTSIQGLLEDVMTELAGTPTPVTGAGRTDAGVHARGQVAAVHLEREIDAQTLVRAANAHLPAAVRVIDAEVVPESFHARFDATAKTYCYRIWNADVLSPFERPYVWHLPGPALDRDAMRTAAALLEGRHDFAAFQGTGSDALSTERRIFASRVDGDAHDGALVEYAIAGDGFLRYMVRNIVGALVEVGRGRRPPAWIGEVLASRDRSQGGRTAPAAGLFLVRVEYGAYNHGLPRRTPHVA